MALICAFCGTVNKDPGGEPKMYRCGRCGNATLKRVPQDPSPDKSRLAAAIAGASILGLATENPVGALIGAVLGFAIGDRLFRDRSLKP